MNDYEKLEWIHFAIQEAQNGNLGELDQALELVEDIREKHMPTRFRIDDEGNVLRINAKRTRAY